MARRRTDLSRHRHPEPLYRKVNTRTHGVHHAVDSGDFRHERNTKAEKTRGGMRGKMRGQKRHGLDYTPLYRFLQSRVGQDWDEVHGEAVARLDREEPIWHLVARGDEDRQALVRVGQSTYFSGLYVDDGNRLQRVDPTLTVEDLEPSCSCCTHTFNGQPYVRTFSGP